MELRHLRYFVAVAEELHFTRAAQRLHLGQPPLSAQIQALEREVGAQLLVRTKRSVRLTDAGKLFLEDARRILALSDLAGENARRASRGEIGELRIGFTSSMPFSEILPRVVNQYRKRYPQVNLSLQEMATMRQIEAIANRVLDVGFIRTPEFEVDAAVELTTLRHDPLVFVLPTSHRLARRKTVAIEDLDGEPFVVYSRDVGTGLHTQVMRLCRQAGFELTIGQEAREASTIIGLVAAGCGISVLPESFQCIKMSGVCYRLITDESATTALLLARRKGESSPLVDQFLALAT
ncbi:MAG TPA: LysR family transcriptional regulator [Burkholderiaceae bacterium]